MLVKNTTTNTCVFSLVIHEVPEALLEALLGNQTKVDKMLFQKVLEEGVAYWSFMFEGTKSCNLLLRMRVEKRDDEEGLLIRVESVDEEGERGDEGGDETGNGVAANLRNLCRARGDFPSESALNGFEEALAPPQGGDNIPAATPIRAGERLRGAKRRAEKARLRDLGAHCQRSYI